MNYYDLGANWHRVEPHVEHPEARAVLARDFSLFIGHPFDPEEECPAHHDWSDWGRAWQAPGAVGYAPEFFWYTCVHAFHWLVSFNLLLAMRAEPSRPWRIVTDGGHSTVSDGDKTVFEPNGLAMGIPLGDNFDDPRWKHLMPSEMMLVRERYRLRCQAELEKETA